ATPRAGVGRMLGLLQGSPGDDVAVEACTAMAGPRPGRPLLCRLRVLRAAAAGRVGRAALAVRRRRARRGRALRRAPCLVRATGDAHLPRAAWPGARSLP